MSKENRGEKESEQSFQQLHTDQRDSRHWPLGSWHQHRTRQREPVEPKVNGRRDTISSRTNTSAASPVIAVRVVPASIRAEHKVFPRSWPWYHY